VVVFDKTGTLTVGKPAVQQLVFIHGGMPMLRTAASPAAANGTDPSTSSCCGKPPSSGSSGSHPPAATSPGASAAATRSQHLSPEQRSVLALLAAVEAGSEHPLAKAIVTYAEQQGVFSSDATACLANFQSQTGRGVRCMVLPQAAAPCEPAAVADGSSSSSSSDGSEGVDVIVGSATWLEECGVVLSPAARQQRAQLEGDGATVVAAAVAGRVAVLCSIADAIKPEAPAVLALLQRRGISCWMITGDSR
jgi:Cu+-exporting ATPase